jgi:ankyrin repeat protein
VEKRFSNPWAQTPPELAASEPTTLIYRDTHGWTPLSLAASYGHEAIVKLLLEAKADIESRDTEYGRTPLSWAAEYGHEAIVKLLESYSSSSARS